MVKIKRHNLSKEVYIKKKRKKGPSKELVLTLIIGGVMILSTFGIMFSSYNSRQEKETYNDFEFVETSDGWMTQVNDEKVYFDYSPSQLGLLNVSPQVISALESPVVIISFNPISDQIEEIEAARLKLAEYFTINMDKAIIYGITEYSDVYNLTVYTCANSTARVPIIELRPVDENKIPEGESKTEETGTKIYLEGTCVVIAARERDWLAASERLVYGMFGIIK
ncbi:MAG: hypothetical protein KJ574_04220 [Nanoarchaeota archaeon]|nr:hypothetical protein [Nanoarchaeota archaeon]